MKPVSILATLALAMATTVGASAAPSTPKFAVSDAALVKTLPGFKNGTADVNGTNLHYVTGGDGPPLVLLPGWPETWWSYHKIMPELAKHFHVIVVDLRGMGSSGKPEGGYDKKTMAGDIAELTKKLGYDKVRIVGHDIGAMVAFSFAENYPDRTEKLVLLDVSHPSAGFWQVPLLPQPGSLLDKADDTNVYLWWFAFNQVKGFPEKVLAGREYMLQEWFFHYVAKNEAALDAKDRAVYRAAYASSDAIRASNGWYQAFPQDIVDDGTYAKFKMPVLGLAGAFYTRLKGSIDERAPGSQTIQVEGSGHFLAEEKPKEVTGYLLDFLK